MSVICVAAARPHPSMHPHPSCTHTPHAPTPAPPPPPPWPAQPRLLLLLLPADLVKAGVGITCVIAIWGGLIASVAGPCARAIMLNVNTPETRGVALALATTTDDLGKGLGPAFVSVFIRVMGRQDAFNVAAAGWVPCAALLASLSFFIHQDEDAMQVRGWA